MSPSTIVLTLGALCFFGAGITAGFALRDFQKTFRARHSRRAFLHHHRN